jgi:sodium-dependent dicarboxylate transporter 2/3/5
MPTLLLVALVCMLILMLTELTSNTATAATFLPVIAAVAITIGENPLLLLVPAAMAANCSFMLPVGTPPNAIVFGSGRIPLPQMAKAGLWLNVTFVVLIVAMVYVLGSLVFGIEPGVLPDWATNVPPA